MKKLYSFLVILSFTINMNVISQQIPNGGFEEWIPTVIWTNNPADWTTDNTEVTAPVFPDSSAFSGELCMTLVPDVSGLGEGDAISETIFDIEYIPEALEFYARWDFVIGQVGVDLTFYNEENEIITFNWQPSPNEPSSDWQLVQMPLDQIEPIITHAVIRCYALVGDLAVATISFDDMQFGTINSIHDVSQSFINIGPNPTSDYLTIDSKVIESRSAKMHIIDNQGRVVYYGNLVRELSVSNFQEGLYVIGIHTNGKYYYEKFTVVK